MEGTDGVSTAITDTDGFATVSGVLLGQSYAVSVTAAGRTVYPASFAISALAADETILFRASQTEAGTLVGWGLDSRGQATAPAGLGRVVRMAAGEGHSAAVRADGTVAAWGVNGYGQTDVPTDLASVVEVAAGQQHTVALKSDGTVVAWGDNRNGQTDVPGGLTGVVEIAAGGEHTVALRADGTVVAWGRNAYGQTNVPGGLSDIVEVDAGGSYTVARHADGAITVWGSNSEGQANVPAEATNVMQIAAGGSHILALRADGTVVAWGYNTTGQTNVPGGLADVVEVAAGGLHSVALKADGTATAWGFNAYGQTDVPAGFAYGTSVAAGSHYTLALVMEPIDVAVRLLDGAAGLAGATVTLSGPDGNAAATTDAGGQALFEDVSAGGPYTVSVMAPGRTVYPTTFAIADLMSSEGLTFRAVPVEVGHPVVWGSNEFGQLNRPAGLTGVVEVAAGTFHTLALHADGTLSGWGDNRTGQAVIPAGLTDVAAAGAGGFHNLVLKTDGTVTAWGWNDHGQTDVPAGLDGVVDVSASVYHSAALRADGTVYAWGNNGAGQTDVPAGLDDVVDVEVAGGFTVALRSNGTIAVWGENNYGQANIPVGLTDVVQIAAGDRHVAALRSDGTVVAWGDDANGQTSVPAGLTGVVRVTAGARHTAALKEDGTVVAWGDDGYGQATVPAHLSQVVGISGGGDHNGALTLAPPLVVTVRDGNLPLVGATVSVSGDASSSATTDAEGRATFDNTSGLAPGGSYAVSVAMEGRRFAPATFAIPALVDDASLVFHAVPDRAGAVAAWGRTEEGQLDVPPELTDAVQISAAMHHTVALRADGTVAAWGDNYYGQTDVPADLVDVAQVSAGHRHVLALKAGGTVTAWGINAWGQLNVPAGLTGVAQVAGGFAHSVALRADGTVSAWGFNDSGQADVPPGLADVVQVDAGHSFTIALRADGTVAAWGDNYYGESTVPAGLADVVQVAAGNRHVLALKADGTVVAWGGNWAGQSYVPEGLSGVVHVAAGGAHSLAVRADGTVVAWGEVAEGQSEVPTNIAEAWQVAAGEGHSVALVETAAFTVTAYVNDGTAPVESATVTLTDGSGSQSLTTGTDGLAAFAGLATGTPFTLSVAMEGATFIPSTLSFASLSQDQAVSFVRTAATDGDTGGTVTVATTTAVTAETGGTVPLSGGGSLVIPEGSLSGTTSVVVGTFDEPPAGAVISGVLYYFGPPGTTFDPPATLTVPYDPASIPEGVTEEDLQLVRFDEATGTYAVVTPSTVDTDANTITAAVSTFSGYGAGFPTGLPIAVADVALPLDPQAVNTQVSASAFFSDPALAGPYTASWDWGDGTTSAGTVAATGTPGTYAVTGSRTYEAPGVYTVSLTVTNGIGGTGAALYQYVVAYDPDGGFVTGGGWIDSPPGAYPANPDVTGKANFGFVAKYKRGQSTPDGNTQFQFRAAGLDFRSTSYQWLVIAGPQAKFKGFGQVNGGGDYGFLLSAVDGEVNGGGGEDKFRIKIWDRSDSDAIVYDNQLGAPEDAEASTVLGGGSITIHGGQSGHGGSNKSVAAEALPEAFELRPAYPNPFSRTATIRFGLPEAAEVTLVVYDVLGREVARLAEGEREAGWHEVRLNERGLASGVYVARLTTADGFHQTQRLTLVE